MLALRARCTDADTRTFIAFSRRHCSKDREGPAVGPCAEQQNGERREVRSESPTFLGGWASAKECAHGGPLFTDEMYSLTAFRSPAWAPGLFFAVGSYYNQSDPEGFVRCELLMSSNRGEAWTRLAPHTAFIPLGAGASWDSHTCCKPHDGSGLRMTD